MVHPSRAYEADSVPLVEMRGVTKRFAAVLANDCIDLEVRRGEVLALLGENGAGKTTLMNVLAGVYQPDGGEIRVRGRPVVFRSPRDAIQAGIGMVHQHFELVNVFTAAENVALGLAHPRVELQLRAVEEELVRLAGSYGWKINPRAVVWQMCVGEQQRVEILRALYLGADVLVLDEPTSVLTPQEAQDLAHTLREIAESGRSVVYISHKLKEVMEVADRIAVLRAGRNVAVVGKAATNEQELTRLMVGQEVPPLARPLTGASGPVRLEIDDLHVAGDVPGDCELLAVRGLSMQVRAGEIVGLAGVAGNGQRELTEAIAGLRPVLSGHVRLEGREITNWHPSDIIRAGISLVPEDRLGTGLVPALSIYDNAILKCYRRPPIARGPFQDLGEVAKRARQLVKEFSVQYARLEDPVWKLSGGNQQRLLLARELSARPDVVVAVHPTRGLDVQATNDVHSLLLRQRNEGCALLLISEDLDEIFALSDRIAVIHEGRLMGMVDRAQASIQDLGLMMAGSPAEVAA